MTVTLRPIGLLKSFCRDRLDPDGRILLADREGERVARVCRDIELPPAMVSLVIVNGRPQSMDYRLQDEDDVKLVALVGGG